MAMCSLISPILYARAFLATVCGAWFVLLLSSGNDDRWMIYLTIRSSISLIHSSLLVVDCACPVPNYAVTLLQGLQRTARRQVAGKLTTKA